MNSPQFTMEETKRFRNILLWDNTDELKVFLERYFNLETSDFITYPLHLAAQYNAEKCIPILIEFGCDVNKFDQISETPLTIAMEHQNLKAMQALLDNGALESLKSSNVRDCMFQKISNDYKNPMMVGTLLRALMMIEFNPQWMWEKLNSQNCLNYCVAVCSGSEELLSYFRQQFKLIANSDRLLNEAVFTAIKIKNISMIKLMSRFIDYSIAYKDGHSPLTFAASQLPPDDDYVKIIKILSKIQGNLNKHVSVYSKWNVIQWVTRHGNVEALRVVLFFGGNLLIKDAANNTLLHIAVQNSDLEVLRFLTKTTINKEDTNNEGKSAADLARESKKIEALNILTYNCHFM